MLDRQMKIEEEKKKREDEKKSHHDITMTANDIDTS